MKLAYFSPLNPQPSGISDYSEELLPYLATDAEITLFVDGFEPSNAEIRSQFKWYDYGRDPAVLETLGDYDAIVYHMGNDHRYHTGIFEAMRAYPGITVFHDFALQDFFLGLARERGDTSVYLDELAVCHGENERSRARQFLEHGVEPPQVRLSLNFPLNCRLARDAKAIVVHSRWAREQFARIAPETPAVQIPMAVRAPKAAFPVSTKESGTLQLSSFGLITPGKGIEQTLRVLSTLQEEFQFRYTLVGAENIYFDVRALIERYNLSDRVSITGHIPLEEFENWIGKTNIAINLRERTVGETSASLSRIMAAGVPAIVSSVGAFAELPDDAVVKVDNDENADSLLEAYFRRLMQDADLRRRIGENARRYILAEHEIEKSAARYLEFISEVVNGGAVKSMGKTDRAAEPSLPKVQRAGTRERAVKPLHDKRLRLAYFSPLNPQASGISDYSEELLPHLADYAEIDLFVDGFTPNNPSIIGRFAVADYRLHPNSLQRLEEYDAVVYHLGNDHHYHAGIIDALLKKPGIAVFHDLAFQDFFLGLARERKNLRIYLDELAACHGTAARDLAEECLRRGAAPPQTASPLDFPMNCRLACAAEGIIVHSHWSRGQMQRIVPSTPIAQINHHVTVSSAASAPRRSGTCIQLASFGVITPDKGLELVLRVLATLRAEFEFHYTLVGENRGFSELDELVRRYDLKDRVTLTGRVPLREFEEQIARTDIALNLRERPVGAMSGSLCRIMGNGVTAFVSNVGAFAELPDDAVIKIDNDAANEKLLSAYLRRFLSDAELRERIGANARQYVLAKHRIEDSAAKYIEFMREIVAGRPRKQLLRSVADEVLSLGVGANHDHFLREVSAQVAVLAPAAVVANESGNGSIQRGPAPTGNEHPGRPASLNFFNIAKDGATLVVAKAPSMGRLPKIEGIDYKRAALEYPQKLDAERNYYLRTKPFYNLANKPDKHLGDGMDAETHRHFSDFANMASALALPAGARVLDVGCGSGWLSEYFARLGYDVTGIDISDELIAMARERVARVPYDVDHETQLRCRFLAADIESKPLPEKFDAVICYDSLHHFEDERAVFRHLSGMLDIGGLLFILEGHKPSAGSATEAELQGVMREYGTLESPFSSEYLRELILENGLVVTGDYVSVNGLFEREMLEGNSLPLRSIATDYHYLTCVKVTEHGAGNSVPDSRAPETLRAEITLKETPKHRVAPGDKFNVPVNIKNTGDTLWLNGQTLRAGIVMPAVRVIDEDGEIVSEVHGHPMLPRPVVPGQSISLAIPCTAPVKVGRYTLKIDLVDQQICWFEERGSEPLIFSFEVTDPD